MNLYFSSAAEELKANVGIVEAVIQHPTAADKVCSAWAVLACSRGVSCLPVPPTCPPGCPLLA